MATDRPERKTLTYAVLIFFFAFALRLIYTLFLRHNYFFYNNPSGDVIYYQQWAQDIARGNWAGDKTFYGLPLYPYFLAVLYRLALGSWPVVRVFHLILGSFNCALCFFIAQQLFNKRAISITAGLLCAANFTLIYYDWLLTPVPLVIFLNLTIIYSLPNSGLSVQKREWFIFGLLLGLNALGDGKILIFTPFLLICLFFRANGKGLAYIKNIFLPLIIGLVLILGTVTARNKIVGGQWVFISAQSGLSFYVGNNEDATGIYSNPKCLRPSHKGQDEDQVSVAKSALKGNA